MKADYKRDLQNNYLILEVDDGAEMENYHLKMAETNEIQGLLQVHTSKRDGKVYLHYEITSKQTIQNVYEKRMLEYSDIIFLLNGIREVLSSIQKYLLNPIHLLFDPQYIYMDPERSRLYFCYYPVPSEQFTMTAFSEFILKKLVHEDCKAVSLGYQFYKQTLEENFSLQRTLKEILSSDSEEKERQNYDEKKVLPEQGTVDSENNTEEEEYEVIHKERKSKIKTSKKQNFSDRLFRTVHPSVIISMFLLIILLELLFYFNVLNLTETGGLFFLIIAVEAMGNNIWRTKKKNQRKKDWVEPEEDELYRILKEEMYDNQELDEKIEETQCLIPSSPREGMRLIPCNPSRLMGVFPEIMIRQKTVYIGKISEEADFILDFPTVSRIHARLDYKEGKYYVQDLNSKNGTFHNGERLKPQEQRQILAGDRLAFSDVEYQVMKI